MKIFSLLLILSCTKVIDKKIEKISLPEFTIDRIETNTKYSEKIDVMVAFLWPVLIETPEQKKAVRDLIRSSRNLQVIQESYFQIKFLLAKSWKEKKCDCVLNQICEGEDSPEAPMDDCLLLEEKIFENERSLPAIYEIVESMKVSVKNSGGEWLKTHTDYPENPGGEILFDQGMMRLTAFASIDEPKEYPAIPFELTDNGRFVDFQARFLDLEKRGEWHFDIAIQRTQEAMKFQGKLFLYQGNSKREGVIYWINPVTL